MQKKKGISLIVLVITIIVMIILAASVVISLNSTSVIDRANQAVKLSDEKQVQNLAAIIWSETYLNNERDENLERIVKEELAKQGVTEDKWNIQVSNSGISVTNKSTNTLTLNEYGFYYDQPYISSDTKMTVCFMKDGDIIILSDNAEVIKGTYTINDNALYIETLIGNATGIISNKGCSINVAELSTVFETTSIDRRIYFDEENLYFYSQIDDGYVVKPLEKNKEEYNPILSSVYGNPVVALAEGAYEGNEKIITAPKLPESIKNIKENAFSDCTNLEYVDFPQQLEIISDYAFYNCNSLKDIEFPEGLLEIGEYAFRNCNSLTKLVISKNITTIGVGAFIECSNVSILSFEKNSKLKKIDNSAFADCNKIESAVIPAEVEVIGGMAFGFHRTTSEIDSLLTNFAFEENSKLKRMGNDVFFGCDSLIKINIPSSVEELGSGIFQHCPNIEEINVDANNKYYTSIDGVLYNKEVSTLICYPQAKKGNTYTMPNTVVLIKYAALWDCLKLEYINLSNTLVKIENRAFDGCRYLKEIFIPNSVKEIGQLNFYTCDRLSRITFENQIGWTMHNGTNIQTIDVSDPIKNLTYVKGDNDLMFLSRS